jgi:hypothetical protein
MRRRARLGQPVTVVKVEAKARMELSGNARWNGRAA